MPHCAVLGCSGFGQQFLFPKTKQLQDLWLEQLKRVDFVLKSHSRICEKHFSAQSFVVDNGDKRGRRRKRKQLRPRAYPTLFLHPNDQQFSEEFVRQEMQAKMQKQAKKHEKLKSDLSRNGYNGLQTVNKIKLEDENSDIANSMEIKPDILGEKISCVRT